MMRIKKIIVSIFPFLHPLWRLVCLLRKRFETRRLYLYDYRAMQCFSNAFDAQNRESALARIIMTYHVVEKGLTMPNRHLNFGRATVYELMTILYAFEGKYGTDDIEFRHAVGVVKAYVELHRDFDFEACGLADFGRQLHDFCRHFDSYAVSHQHHFRKSEFYSAREASFPAFAASRHTCRHYVPGAAISADVITRAVELAQTAPSACNRQHVRVHCVGDAELKERVRNLQGGNRGFGQNADKFLVVTSDICDLRWPAERYDLYTNAGVFVMNLCYALHYYEIAHCVLHWSMDAKHDYLLREALELPLNERVVCLLACGVAPDEFDVATSLRKDVNSILTFH